MGQRDRASYKGRAQAAQCQHANTISTTTAGLQRIVCETCGHVSIRYQGETVRIWPEVPVRESTVEAVEPAMPVHEVEAPVPAGEMESVVPSRETPIAQPATHELEESEEAPDLVIDLTSAPTVSLQSCGACGSTAIYYTPSGLACSYHAWEAASEQEATGVDFWIPILIERPR